MAKKKLTPDEELNFGDDPELDNALDGDNDFLLDLPKTDPTARRKIEDYREDRWLSEQLDDWGDLGVDFDD